MKDQSALYTRLQNISPALELRRDEPMSRHTTFQVGGPAALMALPKTKAEAGAVLRACLELGEKPFFLGNGSNLLVADEGSGGVVVRPGGELCSVCERDGLMWAGAGALLPAVSMAALDRGLSGLEFARGIPGSMGGGVVMNAGAYGGELARAVRAVTYLDGAGEEHTISDAECGFSYRHSVFAEHPDWLVIAVGMELSPGDRAEIRAQMDDFTRRRQEKQPLEYPSAGSAFKRPAPVNGEPVYAAALIEQCGLKGLRMGGAQVSEKHAGFIVNTGGATCKDILALMDAVRERVLRETGVELEPEIRYLR